MINAIRNFFIPPIFKEDEDKSRTAGVLYRILLTAYILLPTALFVQILNPDLGRLYMPLALAVVVISTVLLAIAKRGYVRASSMAFIILLLIISTILDISINGETRPTSILAGAVIVAGGLLLGTRGAFITAILYSVKHILVLFLFQSKIIMPVVSAPLTPVIDGATTFVAYLTIAIIFSLALNSIYSALTRIRHNETELTISNQELQKVTQNLEQRIAERTADLENASAVNEKRARQFETITRVSSIITSVQNLQELLPLISDVISHQFGFYHVGIFLTDAGNQNAVLSAASSDEGKKMLKDGYQLKVGGQGVVGYVTSTGNPRIALDVDQDTLSFKNLDLPETRSEMALPLKVGETIIGALDVQSVEVNAFSTEDAKVLSALADQVSFAIQNARLFGQAEKNLAEAGIVQRQYSRETWGRLTKEERLSGYRYSIAGAVPLDDKIITAANEKVKDRREINVPIILRGETIGSLSVQVPQSDQVSADQVDLIKAVAERVALSAENARLFEETTRRAERERIISDIASKIGTSVRTESILRTTATELSQLLNDAEIFIDLRASNDKNEDVNSSSK